MTDRDRLRILADQGDPIAIGQMYREAKRRGETVVCVSPARQDLTAPAAAADPFAWLEPHVVGWAEQIGCDFGVKHWKSHLRPPRLCFDPYDGWHHEARGEIKLTRRNYDSVHGWGFRFATSTIIATVDTEFRNPKISLEHSHRLDGLSPWLSGSALRDSIRTLCEVTLPPACLSISRHTVTATAPSANDMRDRIAYLMTTFRIPLNEAMQLVDLAADAYASCHPDTATGEQLDALADLVGLERWPGESDASLRERRRLNLHDLPRE